MSESYYLFNGPGKMTSLGMVPEEEAKAFEKRLYDKTKPLIEENDRWARKSLEKAMTTVLR